MEQWLVIGVSGVTCGGKTTLANNLYKFFKDYTDAIPPFLESYNNSCKKNLKIGKVNLICQDNYFYPIDDPHHIVIEHLNHINWEIISSIDMKQMCKDIMEILGTNFILYPTKQMQQQQSDASLMHVADDNLFSEHMPKIKLPSMEVDGDDTDETSKTTVEATLKLNILIIEGFLLFNHPFTLDLCNLKFHIHLPYEKCYERRQKRTYDPPDVLGYFEMVVWPLYDKHCKEFSNRTDIMYLNGEISQDKILNFVISSIKDQL